MKMEREICWSILTGTCESCSDFTFSLMMFVVQEVHVHAELAKVGVTLKLLHAEYKEHAFQGRPYMSYDRFCKRYRDFTVRSSVASRVGHKAGRITGSTERGRRWSSRTPRAARRARPTPSSPACPSALVMVHHVQRLHGLRDPDESELPVRKRGRCRARLHRGVLREREEARGPAPRALGARPLEAGGRRLPHAGLGAKC